VEHVYDKLLLATEHSENDAGAEALAFALARRCGLPLNAVLPIVSNPEYEALAPELASHAERKVRERLEALADAAQRAGVALALHARRGPEPYREIVDEAVRQAADLLVIRRRGRRGLLANLLVGEMVRNVVAHAPCSVLVVPRSAAMWTRRVLVAVDPVMTDMTPVSTGAAIAAQCGVPLTALAVAGEGADTATLAEQALQRAASTALAYGVQAEPRMSSGRAHEQILAAARTHGADLLVIGRRGDESLAHAWLGGVAQKVIGLADLPVLVAIRSAPSSTTTANSP
jgi:nucleotide-binding universal stress UspA family protein